MRPTVVGATSLVVTTLALGVVRYGSGGNESSSGDSVTADHPDLEPRPGESVKSEGGQLKVDLSILGNTRSCDLARTWPTCNPELNSGQTDETDSEK